MSEHFWRDLVFMAAGSAVLMSVVARKFNPWWFIVALVIATGGKALP